MRLSDKPFAALLADFSSSTPTPGGGSASAMAAAVGAALLVMVAGMPKTRTNSDQERQELSEAGAKLTALRDQLARQIDEDSGAYDEVVAAYRLPRATDEEKAARKEAIQAALRHATRIPLQVMRGCSAALAEALRVARHGNRSAASDVGVAIVLLRAGLRGAELNVRINLDGLADKQAAAATAGEAEAIARDGLEQAGRAEAALQ